jgi:hypothetical protein
VTSSGAKASALEVFSVDWTNTNMLLQACLVASCAFAWMFGYRSGDRL